jgi:hypothetical protein
MAYIILKPVTVRHYLSQKQTKPYDSDKDTFSGFIQLFCKELRVKKKVRSPQKQWYVACGPRPSFKWLVEPLALESLMSIRPI